MQIIAYVQEFFRIAKHKPDQGILLTFTTRPCS